MKKCTRCGEVKSLEDFYNSQRGKRCWCITCCRIPFTRRIEELKHTVLLLGEKSCLSIAETVKKDLNLKKNLLIGLIPCTIETCPHEA